MFLIALVFLFLSMQAQASYYDEGRQLALKKSQNQMNSEKEALKNELTAVRGDKPCSLIALTKDKQCVVEGSLKTDNQSALYVFVSFSLPEESWLSLSQEVSKVGGILVLRGLPNNSFQQLAVKMHNLKQKGLKATVQVDPRLFTKYAVENIPCFVTIDTDTFDKLSGNVSLKFALEKMSTQISKQMRVLL
jgi:conjugal transfer pilus assembly protein TrbC